MPGFLTDFLEANLIPIYAIVGLIAILFYNTMMEKRYVKGFCVDVGFALLLIVLETLYRYSRTFEHPSFLGYFTSSVSYALFPCVILTLLFTAFASIGKREKILICIPGAVNVILCTVSAFTPVVYGFTEENVLFRGPLAYLPHSIALLYLLFFGVLLSRTAHKRKQMNASLVVIILLFNVGALILETVKGISMVLSVMTFSFVLFYVFILSAKYRVDSLTGALNRKILYLDFFRPTNHVSAIVSMDLNNLKQLNDTGGHLEGDKALIRFCECCSAVLDRDCRLYRTGGDEFIITYSGTPREHIEEIVENVRKSLRTTPYSCAFGIAYREENDTMDSLLRRADDNMYIDKNRTKNGCTKTCSCKRCKDIGGCDSQCPLIHGKADTE